MGEVIRLDLGGVNSYLYKENDDFILVDTGGHMFMDKEYCDRRQLLEEKLNEEHVTPDNLKLIVLTHGDVDHSFNASYFRNKYQAPIALHRKDWSLVEKPTVELWLANCKYRSLMFKAVFKMIDKKIHLLMGKTIEDFESFTPDMDFEDKNVLKKYGFSARIVETPGHTDGSVGILTDGKAFIAGDTLANNSRPGMAPNALDFKMLKQSIAQIKGMRIEKIYPGHGEPFEA